MRAAALVAALALAARVATAQETTDAAAADDAEMVRQLALSDAIKKNCAPTVMRVSRKTAEQARSLGGTATDRAGQFLSELSGPDELLRTGRLSPACVDALDEEPVAVAGDQTLKIETQRNSSRLAQSFDVPASNPASLSLVQHGGAIHAATLALRNDNFVSADDSAVTLRLSAAMLFCDRHASRECPWDRLNGSVTFGTKIPEKEIVGFSGFPDAERLMDVVVWDASLRLVGDRRPDSWHWRRARNLMALEGAQLTSSASALLRSDLAPAQTAAELGEVQSVFEAVALERYRRLQQRIGSSLLVTASFAGQHLTQEAGKNKYTATLMVDKGLGAVGFTLNGSYSSVQDVSVAGEPAVTLKTWRVAAAFTGDFMKGVLVESRGTEWSLSGRAELPNDGSDVTVHRERVYEAALALHFPVSESARVPFVVTFTNDPNSLSKQRFVRGQVGINYDFGALKKLFE